MRFIEDNWLQEQRIGQGNFDSITSSILSMFDFTTVRKGVLLLNPSTGEPY
jgi:phospholipase C